MIAEGVEGPATASVPMWTTFVVSPNLSTSSIAQVTMTASSMALA